MSDGDVERVMKLAFCSEDDARMALSKTHDVIDAVDMLLCVPVTRGAPKAKVVSPEQEEFMKMRANMESMDRIITKLNQSDSSSQELPHNPSHDQEEMTLRSDCIQHSQIPVQGEEEQKPETVCLSQSECSCD